MTQPVQEPSTERYVSGVEYRTRQLARRPAITHPKVAFPWVRIGQYSRTVPDSITSLLASRFLQYDPALVQEGVDYSWTTTSVGESHDTWLITVVQEAFYAWDVVLNIGVNGALVNDAGLIELYMTNVIGNEIDMVYEAWDIFDTGTFTAGGQGEGHFVVHAAGLTWIAAGRQLRWSVVQSTGANLEIGVDRITVMRMLTTEATTWTEIDSDDA